MNGSISKPPQVDPFELRNYYPGAAHVAEDRCSRNIVGLSCGATTGFAAFRANGRHSAVSLVPVRSGGLITADAVADAIAQAIEDLTFGIDEIVVAQPFGATDQWSEDVRASIEGAEIAAPRLDLPLRRLSMREMAPALGLRDASIGALMHGLYRSGYGQHRGFTHQVALALAAACVGGFAQHDRPCE